MDIGAILLILGVPAHIKGYDFIIKAVELCRDNPDYLEAVVSGLYPAVGAAFNTTGSKVERGIRHAIFRIYSVGGFEKLNGYIGCRIFDGKSRLTNSEFLALLAKRCK